MHNPGTEFANEFDGFEQAGSGPREIEDGHDEFLVVDDASRYGVQPNSRLANGDPGDTGDADDPPDLDTDDRSIDTGGCAAQMKRIVELESQCQTLEAAWLKMQATTKDARAGFEAAQAQLRSYIRGLSSSMPLFTGDRGDSPTDETVGTASQEAESGDSGAGAGEPIGPSGAHDDTEWKDTDLAGVFPPGIVKALAVANLYTLGQLAGYSARGHNISDIKGIGRVKRAVIDSCMDKFWTDRSTSLVK